MKASFDTLSYACSKKVTQEYSTSFWLATKMLSPAIRLRIHSIYGFVRFADEIVDSFHDWDKEKLLTKFEEDLKSALDLGISLNPILNSFQATVKKYDIDLALVDAFLKSMKMDLVKTKYSTEEEYKEYIYGSADVVGLMCLKVFVDSDDEKYEALKDSAMSLGSAFQKVNFLRDLKSDTEILNRHYFPHENLTQLNTDTKNKIIAEIENDFAKAYEGIQNLPPSAKFGVYTAYVYYNRLLSQLKKTRSSKIMETRIRVNNFTKIGLLLKSYFNVKLNLV